MATAAHMHSIPKRVPNETIVRPKNHEHVSRLKELLSKYELRTIHTPSIHAQIIVLRVLLEYGSCEFRKLWLARDIHLETLLDAFETIKALCDACGEQNNTEHEVSASCE